jgi:hypothetical protein
MNISVTFMINESLYDIKIESINIHFSASLFLDFLSLTPMYRRSIQKHIEIAIFIALIAYSWKAYPLCQNIINNNLMEHQLMHFPYWNIIPTVKYLIQSLRFFL